MSDEPDSVAAYMRFYIGDWVVATNDLSIAEEGAYLRLVLLMWKRRGTLTLDHVRFARLCRVTITEWQAIWGALEQFFIVDDAAKVISHGRVMEELTRARKAMAKARTGGSAPHASRGRQPNAPSSQVNGQVEPMNYLGDTTHPSSVIRHPSEGEERRTDQIQIPGLPARPPKIRIAPSREATGTFDQALEALRTLWQEQFGATYAVTPQDKSQLGRLLSSAKKNGLDADLLPDLFRKYVADSDPFLAKQGYSIAWFCTSGAVNRYRAKTVTGFSEKERRSHGALMDWAKGVP